MIVKSGDKKTTTYQKNKGSIFLMPVLTSSNLWFR